MASKDTTHISNKNAQPVHNTLDSDYYACHRIPVIVQGREVGKVFADVKDNLVIIAGENKKEHEYLIPKSKVSHYSDNKIYLNILNNSLKEFEV